MNATGPTYSSPRLLNPADAEAYVALRREMLVDSPWAFLASPGDDRAGDAAGVAGRLAAGDNAIAVVDDADGSGRLVASAGVVHESPAKIRHRALIWGVYVTPRARGRGLGEAVMRLAIATARSWTGVEVVTLSASERSAGALRLYRRLGFVEWGVEPDAVRIGGESVAEVHMRLRLVG